MSKFLYFLGAIFVLITLTSCASQSSLEAKKTYKMEMFLQEGDSEAIGMLALDRKKSYDIYMTGEERMALLSFRSCSREVLIENPASWRNKKRFYYKYIPNEVERGPSCPVIISAINKDGFFASGMIDFIDETTSLPATNICGEYTEKTKGVNVCESRKESMQRIIFDVEVAVVPTEGCDFPGSKRGLELNYRNKVGECTYGFVEVKPPYRKARLTTHGYDDIQVKL